MSSEVWQQNMYRMFADGFPSPSALFIEGTGGRKITYGEVESGSARLANALVGFGVVEGDRVMVQTHKSPEVVLLYLACLRINATFVPLNTAYTEAELRYFLTDAEPRLIVCDPASPIASIDMAVDYPGARLETLDAAGQGSLTEAATGLPESFVTAGGDGSAIACILYTSGTTGRPKGAMLSHSNLGSNAATLREAWGFTADDVLLHVLPVFHAHGLFVAINTVLANGTSMIFLPRFDVGDVLASLPRASIMMGVPTFYTRLLGAAEFTRETCAHLRLFISGSAPLLAEVHEEFSARSGHAILERYGMTETAMNTSNPLDGARVPGSVGPPLPGIEARIVDEDDKALATGEVGAIQVRGPNVFTGYWRKPDKTAEDFCADGFFKTGDVGYIDEHGYVFIVGRAKDLVISGGYNVYPKEVEACIDELDGIGESAVIGVPHADFGEAVVAVVTRAGDGNAAPEQADVIAALKTQLAGYKVPKAVVFVDEIPRNVMGKVEKGKLREAYQGILAPAAT